MARKKKEELYSSIADEKKPTIFDLISYLTDKKVPWNKLSEYEKKLFNPYMIHRFLSMDLYLIEAINSIQIYTLTVMDKKDVYNLLFHLLPKKRYFLRYIKAKADIPAADMEIMKKYFKLSKRELEDYYNILMKDEEGKEFFKTIKANYAYEENEKNK